MYKIGCIVVFAGREWEIYSFDTDNDGFLVVMLIEPRALGDCETSPSVAVRDITQIQRLIAA